MSTRLRDQISAIKYYRIILSAEERRDVDINEATGKYLHNGYAEKYAGIWYEGIPRGELKEKMFGDLDKSL